MNELRERFPRPCEAGIGCRVALYCLGRVSKGCGVTMVSKQGKNVPQQRVGNELLAGLRPSRGTACTRRREPFLRELEK